MEINFEHVFKTLKRYAQGVPLEVFTKDKYKTLISTLLSSRTKDEITLEASKRLFKKAPNLQELRKLKVEEIMKLIYPVGFYKVKAKHLYQLARIINSVPSTREDLMKLPGVGRKTANLTLNRAFGIPAIAVDTHVHRICNLLGWVKTKLPEETEFKLMEFLPKKYWSDINKIMVGIGRKYGTGKKLTKFLKDKELISSLKQ